ncbi:MAG TPA: FCD domain-containing protein [Bosea sp. (in: a-proteobacteria)]|jgi:GntR family transcriptional repressor for pyruvate dehydrogenase complex|nr:FCD domain-containing protein [Bosea sp. (in: a-proteobacteria)]
MTDTQERPRLKLAPIDTRQVRAVSIEVARVITAAIEGERLAPGDRLPPERDLAGMLKVSRTSVRDALKVLAGMGTLRIRRNHGVFVADAADRHIDGEGSAALSTANRPLSELFELRRVLETQATAWAAERASVEQLRQIDAVYGRFSLMATRDDLTREEANAFDIEIHALIAEASANSLVAQIVTDLRAAAERERGSLDGLRQERIASNVADFGAIVDALRRRDADAARAAMLEHLDRGQGSIIELREANGASSTTAPDRAPIRSGGTPG